MKVISASKTSDIKIFTEMDISLGLYLVSAWKQLFRAFFSSEPYNKASLQGQYLISRSSPAPTRVKYTILFV